MSNSSPSVLATCLTSAASTLTPMLMLPDLTMVARLAASAMSLSFSPAEPGGADDVHQRCSRGELREGDGRGRNREVEQAVRLREQRLDVGAHLDAVVSEPGELAGVTPDHRRAGGVDRADKRHAVDRRNGVDQRAPHAPAGAHHDQPHVGHGSSPGNVRRYSGTAM